MEGEEEKELVTKDQLKEEVKKRQLFLSKLRKKYIWLYKKYRKAKSEEDKKTMKADLCELQVVMMALREELEDIMKLWITAVEEKQK